jgi:membrane protease YdiL (CAAX protease family)
MDQSTAFFYIMFWVAFLAVGVASKAKLEELRLLGTLFFAFVGLIACWAVTLYLYGVVWEVDFPEVSQVNLWGLVIMQVLYVAVSEEFVFRYALPQILMAKFKNWLAFLIPQITFALYHMAAYQGDWDSIIIAFIFGCVMMFCYRIPIKSPVWSRYLGPRLGYGFCVGCHAAYNLVLLGVLSGGISMVGGG